jgi:murein DD-endopeptidase MepM/ murein hydrolase activator NlpD
MAYLTAVYLNFPYDGISADLQALFNEQYTLTFTPTVETRYHPPSDPDGDPIPYDWHVMTVTLTARSFNELIMSKMNFEQQAHYVLLMQTKGNRQYAGNPFDVGWLPYVTSWYGYRIHPITGEKDLHRGIDIALPEGTVIKSAQDGKVTFSGNNGGYGNVVVIENDNGIVTKYAHCDTLLVSVGQTVSKGDPIATVGNTGTSTGAHLHFELMKDGEYLNPAYFTDTGSFNLTPNYGIPGAAMGDGTYAALLAEAEKYLGFPYVWGGSSPSTSFDCSGYISYILRTSGVKDVGRQTAQGLYNMSTPILPSAAQPGDLVFFTGTYSSANPVTHVGLYVGIINGHPTMIHAGSPISYARLDTPYWQSHFYSYARLN